jgi:tetratricopeptide (TPR) repeat protein
VGLVGERVGYIPDGGHARWVADQAGVPSTQRVEGLSVTELEFGFGMLWDSAPDGEHVVAFRDLIGETPQEWVDPDRVRVVAFREEIAGKAASKGASTIRYEAAADGDVVALGAVVVEDGLLSFEDLMVGALAGPVRRRAEQVIAESGSGWSGQELLFRDDHRLAIGREELIADLAERALVGNRVVVVGESGTGKSTILCGVEEQAAAVPGVTVVSALLGASTTGVSGRDVVLRLVEQLESVIGQKLAPDRNPGDPLTTAVWRDMLTEAAGALPGRLVVVIDALDLLADDQSRLDVWPARVVPPGIGLVCSTTDPEQAQVLANSDVEIVPVGDLSSELAVQAAQMWAGRSGRELPAPVLTVIGAVPRSPLWVRLAVDLLADLDGDDFASIAGDADQATAIERLLMDRVTALPADAEDVAGVFLGRVGERIGDRAAAVMLGALATVRSGFAPTDLAALLPDDPDAAHKVAVVQRVLGDQMRTVDAAGRIAFAHAALQRRAAGFAGPNVHTSIVGVLAADDAWDDVDACDAVWHAVHASAEPVQGGPLDLPRVLERALNQGPPGLALVLMRAVLMRAVDAHPSEGIAMVGGVDRSELTVDGLDSLLRAQTIVDRRHVLPLDRVALSRAVLGVVRGGEGPTSAEAVTVALANLATELHQVGGLQESLDAYSESLAVARAEVAAGNSGAEAQAASVMSRVGDLRIALNDLEGALTVFSEQLDLRRAAVAAEPDSAELGLEPGIAWANVGRVREARGEWDAAAHAYAESVQLRRTALEADPDAARFSGGLMFGLNCLGRVREAQRDQAGARRAFEESLGLARAQMRAHPGSMTARMQLTVALNDVGRMHDAAGDLAGALRLFDEQLSMVRGMVDAQPGSAEVVRLLVVALTSVGVVRQSDGDLDGAMEAFGESLELARERLARSRRRCWGSWTPMWPGTTSPPPTLSVGTRRHRGAPQKRPSPLRGTCTRPGRVGRSPETTSPIRWRSWPTGATSSAIVRRRRAPGLKVRRSSRRSCVGVRMPIPCLRQ